MLGFLVSFSANRLVLSARLPTRCTSLAPSTFSPARYSPAAPLPHPLSDSAGFRPSLLLSHLLSCISFSSRVGPVRAGPGLDPAGTPVGRQHMAGDVGRTHEARGGSSCGASYTYVPYGQPADDAALESQTWTTEVCLTTQAIRGDEQPNFRLRIQTVSLIFSVVSTITKIWRPCKRLRGYTIAIISGQ